MKASDTVLKPNELIRTEDFSETNTDIEASLIKQSEITRRATIKEVVGWFNAELAVNTYDDGSKLLFISNRLWQSKLKEWGIQKGDIPSRLL